MFIPMELRPKHKPCDETTLAYIFNLFDEMLEVTKIAFVSTFFLKKKSSCHHLLITYTCIAFDWHDRKSLQSLQWELDEEVLLVSEPTSGDLMPFLLSFFYPFGFVVVVSSSAMRKFYIFKRHRQSHIRRNMHAAIAFHKRRVVGALFTEWLVYDWILQKLLWTELKWTVFVFI